METSQTQPTPSGTSSGPTSFERPEGFRLTLAQVAAAARIEAGQQLRGLGAFGLGLLALLPALPWLIVWLTRVVTGSELLLSDVTESFAVLFQAFTLPLVLFFSCVIVFMGAGRRDVRQRTLHHYLLCPVPRRYLLAGKYLAGLAISFCFLAASTIFCFALAYGQLFTSDRFAAEQFLFGGPGAGHLAGYLGAVLLGCAGYGAVFLALSLWLKNPIVPVVGVFGWEGLQPFLPPGLKLGSIYHYLRAVCPVPADQGPFALLAEPPPVWLAVLGLAAVSGVLLVLAGRRLTRLEIDYGDE